MRSVANLDSYLSPYLGVGAQTYGTTTLKILNHALPRLYGMGDWKSLRAKFRKDVMAGYFALPHDWECVLSASLNDYPMKLNSLGSQTQVGGFGSVFDYRPAGSAFGLIDGGMEVLMSEIATVDDVDGNATSGADEFIFTCASAAFASGDTATITYTDLTQGYAQVVLPLHTITVASATSPVPISVAADGGTDATTGEILTTLTTATNTAMGLVAGLGLTLAQNAGTDATYIGTFRIHSIPSSTSVKIVKAYVALTGSLTAVTTPRLMPVSKIESVESLAYASLPGRTLMKDADGIIYADLPMGDGLAQYRRYDCPQVPEDAVAGDWIVNAIVKRAFVPLTSTSDIVYLDNLPALTAAFLAVVARDAGDHKRERELWADAARILSEELFDTRGGVQETPVLQLWGDGVPGMQSAY